MTEPSHEFTRGLYGWITHTDMASEDPPATRAWCEAVLGWTFQDQRRPVTTTSSPTPSPEAEASEA